MSDVTPEQAMSRIAKIDQELAFHSGTSGARAAVDATRDDLVFWKDFLGSTAEELKGATETIESTVEDLKEGSLATGPTFTSEEVTEALDGDDSSLGEWIKAAQEKTDGIVGDFVAAGDVTPESLEEEIEEFTGTFEEVIEGLTERASGTSSGLKELLERDDVKKHIDQLQSGVGAGSDIASGINDGIGKIDNVLESLQNIDDLTSDDAATQLNAAADLFDELVGLFGDSITMIPGLGAFLSLYGKAFRGAAHSAGVIQGIADRNNRLYQIDRPGRFLWITSESLRADRIRKLKHERSQLMDDALAAATQERLDRADINYVAPKSDREVAVELGIRSGNAASPAPKSQAYQEWATSSANRDAALKEVGASRVVLHDARGSLAEAKIAMDRPKGSSDALADAANLTEAKSGLKAAEGRSSAAETNYGAALETHAEKTSAHQAEIDAHDDAIRQGVIDNAAKTNSGQGFSTEDWDWFNRTYPKWRVSPDDLISAVPVASAASAVADASAGTDRKRLIMIGGGGLFGIAMLIGAFFYLSDDGTITAADPASVADAESAASQSDQTAESAGTDDASSVSPTDTSAPGPEGIEAVPPVDDGEEAETPGCDLPSDGPHPRVVPHLVIPAVDVKGNLHFNVQMCEPGDHLLPFGQFYSGFFQCPPFFGFEIHNGVRTVLLGVPEAWTLVDGSYWFNTRGPPPDPFPSSVPCMWASWNSQEDPVRSGEGVIIFPPPATGDPLLLFIEPSIILTEGQG